MKNYSLGNIIRAGAWGAILGGAAGFAVGLLLAPEEGQKIRRRVAFQLEKLSGQIGSFVEQVSTESQDSDARREGNQLVEDAKQRAQQIRDDIDELLGQVRKDRSSKRAASTG